LLTLSRISLSIWQADRIADSTAWLQIIFQGLRIDIATVCWLYTPPAAITCLMPVQGTIAKIWQFVLRCWLVDYGVYGISHASLYPRIRFET
jgi:hypothetical protein